MIESALAPRHVDPRGQVPCDVLAIHLSSSVDEQFMSVLVIIIV